MLHNFLVVFHSQNNMPLKRSVPPQEQFFYNGAWTPEMDARFLRVLLEQKNIGYWVPPNIPVPSALLTAKGVVNAEFGINFEWPDIKERVRHYEARYTTFSQLVNLPKTYWDRELNCVLVEDRVWIKIFMNNSLARAYYHKEEPEFNHLAAIFGPTELKDEHAPQVINIRDDTDRVQEAEPISIHDSDTEVTSPYIDDNGSSCASSDPFNWRQNPFY